MSTNQFLPIAIAGSPNVQSQADYAGSTPQEEGFATGEIPTAQAFNKMLRQASFINSQIAQAVSDILAVDVLDNGDAAAFLAQFKAMLHARPAVSVGTPQASYADAGVPGDTARAAAAGYLYTVTCQMLGILNNANGTPITPIIDIQIKDGATVLATITTNYQTTAVPTSFNGYLPFGGTVENLPAPASGSYTFHVIDSEGDGASHSYSKSSLIASVTRANFA